MARRRAAILIAMVCVLAHAPAALATAPGAAPGLRSGEGLTVVSVRQVDPRLVALVVKTVALPAPANLYILFPPGYSGHPRQRYPVLYLLHGTSGTASDWTRMGDAEKVIGDRPLITVMPDIALNDGGGGWCTNWPDGAQSWETFHIHQLVPWVDVHLRTLTSRGERAIAGLSQGGFCSLSYAARHPDLFGDALGYSGAPDIYYDPDARAGAKAVINATEVGLDHVAPDSFFGDQASDGINWAAHDPASLAENLRWTRMYMYWGNGQPGPYDTTNPVSGGNFIEELIWGDNNDFQARLNALGIPAYFDDYGAGTHSWPYWTRDLKWSIDKVMFDFAHPSASPPRFTYTSADDRYSIYGWRVAVDRAAREFSTLANASRGGFTLSGSGTATVLTPPVYARRARYAVRVSGDAVSSNTVFVRARHDRRLQLTVLLGPANQYQQYTPQAEAAGTAVYTTTVTITRAPRRERAR